MVIPNFEVEYYPSEAEKKAARLTSRQKNRVRKGRRYTCELSGERVQIKQKAQLHVHHMRPVQGGGKKRARNLMTILAPHHEALHNEYVPIEMKRLHGINKYKAEEHHVKLVQTTEEASRALREATRLSRVINGEDPKFVYGPEYYDYLEQANAALEA